MNQYFYESRGREKLSDLRREGMASQAYHRMRPTGLSRIPRRPAAATVLAVLLGILAVIIR